MKFKMGVIIFVITASLLFSGCTTEQKNDTEKNDNLDFETNEVILTYLPIDLENLSYIAPYGSIIGIHVDPIDHQYWNPPNSLSWEEAQNSPEMYEIKAPADGYVTRVSRFEDGPYRFVLEFSDDVYSIFMVVYNLTSKLLSDGPLDPGDSYTANVEVSAGETIAYIKNHPFDFSLHDERVNLLGFPYPEDYESYGWKVHTVDPFEYYEEPLRTQLREKSLRKVEPVAGKIDYDIPGKLVGTWFIEGSSAYRMTGEPSDDHKMLLSIVYDYIDPNHIVISFGDYEGESRPFGVKGNSPDPKDIGISSGMTKYELVEYVHWQGEDPMLVVGPDPTKSIEVRNNDEVHGTVLFELLEERKLKMEIFPSMTAAEVSNFTDDAFIYFR